MDGQAHNSRESAPGIRAISPTQIEIDIPPGLTFPSQAWDIFFINTERFAWELAKTMATTEQKEERQ